MRLFRISLPSLGVVRFVLMICVPVLVFFSFAVPLPVYGDPIKATPGTSNPSDVTKGEEQLIDIEKKTWDFLKPENTFSPEKIRSEANKGLNEVQGDADINKMKRPDNRQDATTVERQVEQNLAKLQGKAKDSTGDLKR
jgi:predicted metal-dependent peptidase